MASQKIMPRNKANQLKLRPIVENNITITHKDVARDWDYEKTSSNRRTRAPIMLSEGRSKN